MKPINWGAAIVVAIVAIWVSAYHGTPAPDASDSHDAWIASSAAPAATEPPDPANCQRATSYRNEAVSSYNAHAYRDAYKNAVTGLRLNDQCNDEEQQLVNHGYLLASKGLAEHYLSEGDWRTDLNQAGMLLEECVTKPGLYGTQTGAGCETEQESIISWKTGWEMGQ